MQLSDKQYQLLMELFHEFNEAFVSLPEQIQAAYYQRLYQKD